MPKQKVTAERLFEDLKELVWQIHHEAEENGDSWMSNWDEYKYAVKTLKRYCKQNKIPESELYLD